MKKTLALCLSILLLSGCAVTYDGPTESKYVLSEKTETDYAYGKLQCTLRTIYAYDLQGNLVREKRYWNEDLDSVLEYRYDDRGNKIFLRDWDHTKLIPLHRNTRKNTYDDQNRILTAVDLDFWGRETLRLTYTYDDEANTYTMEESSGRVDNCYLDESGRQIRWLRDIGGVPYEYRYEYDDRGNLIRSYIYEDGKPYSSCEMQYDDRDRLIREQHFDAAGQMTMASTTEYDDDALTVIAHYFYEAYSAVEYTHYDTEGRILLVECYHQDGTLSGATEYTYQQIQVPAKEETP